MSLVLTVTGGGGPGTSIPPWVPSPLGLVVGATDRLGEVSGAAVAEGVGTLDRPGVGLVGGSVPRVQPTRSVRSTREPTAVRLT